MTYSYQKTEPVTEVLSDLIKINNDRIANYRQALDQSKNIDENLHDFLKSVVSESESHKQQLVSLIKQRNGQVGKGTTVLGKIYRAWMDLRGTLALKTPKNIMASCQYNEQVALQVYKAALSDNVPMSEEIRLLIEKQENALRRTHDLIKSYRRVPHVMAYPQIYFN